MSPGHALRTRLASRSTALAALAVLVLALENLWFFHAHYSGAALFPWDFQKTYHAVPFFWTSAAGAGLSPAWIPFQGVGYPLALNLQSGFFYPPLWIFPLTGATYSLHAAAVLQALHVLLGALGMLALARSRGLAWPWALVAAAAFQVFGGFFGGAEHVDIVRGYAWTPWLLLAASVGAGERGLGPLRARLLPLVVFAFLTGAYPGQASAALALSAVYLGAQLVAREGPLALDRARLRGVALRAGYLALGVALALVHLLPAWLHREELLRARPDGELVRFGLGWWNAFTTIFPYDAEFLHGSRSMRSLFVTVPVLAGLLFARARDLRAELPALALGLAAAALIPGAGPLYRLAVSVFPPLGFSRFPAADERALVAVPLVLLGTIGLRSAFAEPWRVLGTGLRFAAIAAFVWAGFARWRGPSLPGEEARALVLVLLATVLALALGRVRGLGVRAGAWAALLLVVADGQRMHGAVTEPWRALPQAQAHGRTPAGGEDFDAMRAELVAALQATREQRPARREQPTLDGYRRGAFVFHDYAGGEHLATVAKLMGSRPLARFVKRPGSPLLFAEESALVPVEDALDGEPDPQLGTVRPESFGPREIRYAVSARAPALLIENEPALPGWKAVRSDLGTELAPLPQAWPLRAWRLPAGDYSVVLTFAMPGFGLAAALSLVAAAAWIAVLLLGARGANP